jgi:hypothetical protein
LKPLPAQPQSFFEPFPIQLATPTCPPPTPPPQLTSVGDVLLYVGAKVALRYASFETENLINDLRKPQRGKSGWDRFGDELLIALLLEPAKKGFDDAYSRF